MHLTLRTNTQDPADSDRIFGVGWDSIGHGLWFMFWRWALVVDFGGPVNDLYNDFD